MPVRDGGGDAGPGDVDEITVDDGISDLASEFVGGPLGIRWIALISSSLGSLWLAWWLGFVDLVSYAMGGIEVAIVRVGLWFGTIVETVVGVPAESLPEVWGLAGEFVEPFGIAAFPVAIALVIVLTASIHRTVIRVNEVMR